MTVFRAAEAVASGTTTWGVLRGPGYLRVAPNCWVPAGTVTDIRIRAETLAAWSHGTGVVAGPLAARVWRADCPWDDAELVMRTPRRLPPPATRVRTGRLRPDEVARRWDVAVTTPVRTAFDLARRPPLVEAVAAVDALAYRCGFTAEHLREIADRHPRIPGSVQVRGVLDLMDGRAQSLPESRLRLLFVLRGLPRPVPQYPVTLRAGRGAYLDLGWPDPPAGRRPVGVEYDGEHHRTVAGQGKDSLRNGDLDDLDWDITHVAPVQLVVPRHADRLAERIRRKVT